MDPGKGAWKLVAAVAAVAVLLVAGQALVGGPEPSAPEAGVARQGGDGGEASRGGPDTAAPSTLTRRFPRPGHRTATIRRGFRVAVLRSPGGRRVGWLDARTPFGSRTVLSVIERRGPWVRVSSHVGGNRRPAWIRLAPRALRLGSTPWSLRVDLSDRRLELLRGRRVVDDALVTVGGPDTPTPLGRFAVTDRLDSRERRTKISPIYGIGALATSAVQRSLPPDWPGGDRIAIHGWDGIVGEVGSNGCLRATDHDMSRLLDQVPPGAPLTIAA